ncbi:MAG: Ca-activated chloride channel family protein [Verrucomicrobiales bacterium]|jgi:Ca-activated chloride channel family protein
MFPHFQQPWWLFGLIFVAAAAGLFFLSERTRKLAIRYFLGGREEANTSLRDRRFEVACVLTGMALLVIALARPAWKEIPEDVASENRDVIFLLDVSRSMLASDLQPDRLTSAKLAIRSCVRDLENHRIGLVAFAGSSSIMCPLTNDYSFFFDKLEEAGPEIVDQGGTRIGDAILKTTDKLLSEDRRGLQDVILLSDGGDQDSGPEKAAAELERLGVYFVVIGIGDARVGARVPARVESGQPPAFTMHNDREVWSKLETGGLSDLAKSCPHGVFFNAGTKALQLGDLYTKLVEHFRREAVVESDEQMMRWEDTFPFFLVAALVLLAPPFVRWGFANRGGATAALLLFAAMFSGEIQAAGPDDPQAKFNLGCQQLLVKNFLGARESFMAAAVDFEHPDRRMDSVYNAGIASFREGKKTLAIEPGTDYNMARLHFMMAKEAFRTCLQMRPGHEDTAWNLEVTLWSLADVEERQKSDEDTPVDEKDPEEGDPEDSESEENEGETEEAENEGEMEPSDQQQGEHAVDMEAQDIPPPMLNPEDLLEQEEANAEAREKSKSGKYKAVERDW